MTWMIMNITKGTFSTPNGRLTSTKSYFTLFQKRHTRWFKKKKRLSSTDRLKKVKDPSPLTFHFQLYQSSGPGLGCGKSLWAPFPFVLAQTNLTCLLCLPQFISQRQEGALAFGALRNTGFMKSAASWPP